MPPEHNVGLHLSRWILKTVKIICLLSQFWLNISRFSMNICYLTSESRAIVLLSSSLANFQFRGEIKKNVGIHSLELS